ISAFATGLGNRPAIVIIEPDAVAQLDCLPSDAERQTRLGLRTWRARPSFEILKSGAGLGPPTPAAV
ncbi:hypothetical protein, partial [Corallococcus sicarius]|uniref:hypothetical protein n=1 Tax=Corallococcus sicarius TaxID=2316726 RepID=UPI001ABEF0DC